METKIEKPNRKEYMREYKKKQYKINSDKIKEDNRMYYYKKQSEVSIEKIKEYKCDNLKTIAKLIICLNKLKDSQPEMLTKVLADYV